MAPRRTPGLILQELQNGSRPEEIQQAQHNLDEARATLVNDKITLDRTRGLVTEGVLSKQALDDATAKFESDQQRVNSLDKGFQLAKIGPRQEEIARARGALQQAQGQADYAKSLLDATVIRAPVTGTILERAAEKGELVTSGFASTAEGGPQGLVVSLADLNDLQVELDIAQDDFAKLGPKQKGAVTVDAYPDRKWDGVIAEISPQANRAKATVQVKVQILNPDAYLRPDMNATVKFLADETKHTSSQPQGVFVPTPAIRDRDGKKFVFLSFDGKATAREVKILSQRSGGVAGAGPQWRRRRHHIRARRFERRRKNQDQRTVMSAATVPHTAIQTKVVQARNVSKVFKRDAFEVKALDDVSIEIGGGEFLALMGPSGSGKTTLLNMIAAIDRPTAGELLVLGENIFRFSDAQSARWRNEHIGYVFQTFNLIPVLTAFENVELPLLLTKLSAQQRRDHVMTALKLVGLEERVGHLPKQLSGGQEQRVAIARAIVSDPTLLLADEPTGDLDSHSATEVLEILKRLNEDFHKTIVMVTHDPHAASYAHVTRHLEKGMLLPA